mmetsp:Transcript_97987/g.260316  ORF Transcript_97987/g.260316 Transcript_97987/m.260316 type:complete len:359 (+) Transcript_97987:1-1077(+)
MPHEHAHARVSAHARTCVHPRRRSVREHELVPSLGQRHVLRVEGRLAAAVAWSEAGRLVDLPHKDDLWGRAEERDEVGAEVAVRHWSRRSLARPLQLDSRLVGPVGGRREHLGGPRGVPGEPHDALVPQVRRELGGVPRQALPSEGARDRHVLVHARLAPLRVRGQVLVKVEALLLLHVQHPLRVNVADGAPLGSLEEATALGVGDPEGGHALLSLREHLVGEPEGLHGEAVVRHEDELVIGVPWLGVPRGHPEEGHHRGHQVLAPDRGDRGDDVEDVLALDVLAAALLRVRAVDEGLVVHAVLPALEKVHPDALPHDPVFGQHEETDLASLGRVCGRRKQLWELRSSERRSTLHQGE